jgi:selenide,water dikinase
MATLNQKAAEIMTDYKVHACTDVTGFGLLGHLKEMTMASGLGARITADKVPLLNPAREMATSGIIPGGTENNLQYLADWVDWDKDISEIMKVLLCDAQTSGGLLISVAADQADKMLNDMHEAGVKHAAVIGSMVGEGKGRIKVVSGQ